MVKPSPKKAPEKRDNRQSFTQYGFIITAHSGKKESPNGSFSAANWHGQLKLETANPVHDEIDAERELEVLLANGFLPFFGLAPALMQGISFAWDTRFETVGHESNGDPIQESVTVCSVQLNYLAGLDPVTPSEAAYRLQQSFGENWQDIVNRQGR